MVRNMVDQKGMVQILNKKQKSIRIFRGELYGIYHRQIIGSVIVYVGNQILYNPHL